MRRLLAVLMAVALGMAITGVSVAQDTSEMTYQAELHPLNADTTGSETSGDVTIAVSGDDVKIEITVTGVSPSMQHWQHFHGFADSVQEAACPTTDDDANNDGIIDLIETEAVAGTTMVPFNDDPVRLDIPADTYPEAGADGSYTYMVTVSRSELEAVFSESFPESDGLSFANRVVFIHGVPDDAALPDTVQSLGDIPAQVTLPIACGNIELLQSGTPQASPAASPMA
jgi:hypothetical protein